MATAILMIVRDQPHHQAPCIGAPSDQSSAPTSLCITSINLTTVCKERAPTYAQGYTIKGVMGIQPAPWVSSLHGGLHYLQRGINFKGMTIITIIVRSKGSTQHITSTGISPGRTSPRHHVTTARVTYKRQGFQHLLLASMTINDK